VVLVGPELVVIRAPQTTMVQVVIIVWPVQLVLGMEHALQVEAELAIVQQVILGLVALLTTTLIGAIATELIVETRALVALAGPD